MYSFRGLIIGVAALMLLLAGCGGDSETTSPAISKRILLAKVNAACRKDNEKISAAFDRLGKKPGFDEVQFAVENVLPIREAQIRRLQRMGPPDEDVERFERLLAAMEEGVERAKRDPSSLIALEDEYAFWTALELGIAFGLDRCFLN